VVHRPDGPTTDAEFTATAGSNTLTAPKGTAAYNRADLLTAVMHEMAMCSAIAMTWPVI